MAEDWDWTDLNLFLSTKGIEGPSNPQLHYPGEAGKSGATIARGFDLGQHDLYDIHRIFDKKEDAAIIRKISLFLGKTGQVAKDLVAANPELTLTHDEQITVLEKTIGSKVKPIVEEFNKDSKIGNFATLPHGLKNLITSVYYQMGESDPRGTAPGFWRQVTTGDWEGLEKNMGKFGMKDESGNERRRVEWDESGLTIKGLKQWSSRNDVGMESSLIDKWKREDNIFA
jgi:hypothetical protein|tara:strand:+ start:94 stop:777 length:684 start_codon:yes stop_codon:yes gene_type:complete